MSLEFLERISWHVLITADARFAVELGARVGDGCIAPPGCRAEGPYCSNCAAVRVAIHGGRLWFFDDQDMPERDARHIRYILENIEREYADYGGVLMARKEQIPDDDE